MGGDDLHCAQDWLYAADASEMGEAGGTRPQTEEMIAYIGDHKDRYKAEVIYRRAPWQNMEAVEYATMEWVDWFNHQRLLEPIGNVPPADLEAAYYRQLEGSAKAA